MRTKTKRTPHKGSASVEVIMSVGVFMVLALVSFWIAARVYAAIYGISATAARAGLSTLFNF